MEAFALYLLKSIIWLSGFALVFILFLRNERFFRLNRYYLIAGILISFLLPLVSVHYTVVLPAVSSNEAEGALLYKFNEVGISSAQAVEIFLFFLYLSGVLFVVFSILTQNRSVIKVIRKAGIISSDPVKLIRTADYTSSFSFFSYVFVNSSVTDHETKEILNHEMVHIRQKHWVDLVLVELLCIVQWFNPIVWTYGRLIRQNHEYLADEVALQRTSDPAIYKATLLNQIFGSPVVSLSNSFNYSLNKKRFIMMKNIISSPYRKLKIFLVLPVFAIVLYSFAKPEYRYIVIKDPSIVIKTQENDQDTVPKPIAPQQAEKKVTKGKSDAGVLVPAPPPPPPPANEVGIISDFEGSEVDTEAVLSINVLKDKNAIDKYGEKGKDGVIEITTKKRNSLFKTNMSDIKVIGYSKNQKSDTAELSSKISIRSNNTQKSKVEPLIVIDGNIYEIGIDSIDPETIESINVLKDKSAIEKYGEKALNGVIEITTKKKAEK